MMVSMGPTFRLLRNEYQFIGKDVSIKTGINHASITRFEQGKENLSEEKLQRLKEFYQLVDVSSHDLVMIEKCFENIFNYLFYLDRNYREELQTLKDHINLVASTVYYPLYYIFDYCITIQDNSTNKKIKQEKVISKLIELEEIISRVEDVIPKEWLSLFYDYQGEMHRYQYNYQKALEKYALAERMSRDDKHIGLINYRMALCYTQDGTASKALKPLEIAKNQFGRFMNFERQLGAEFLNGTIYMDMRNYDEALTIFERCLYISHKGHYQLNAGFILNNIMWMYIMKRDFNNVIYWSHSALELGTYKEYAYLYRAWANYALDNIEEALNDLESSKLIINELKDITDEKHFELMSMIIKKKTKSSINAFYKRTIRSIKASTIDTKLFIYQMMEIYYKKMGDEQKEIEFKNLYFEELAMKKV